MMMWKYGLMLVATGVLMTIIVIYSADASGSGTFTPFSGNLTVPVIIALAISIVVTVTGLAGLMPEDDQQ